jgi:hypothetical protein
MSNKLMTIAEYLKSRFEPGSAPSVYTIRRWITAGKLEAVKMGREYYIVTDNSVSYTYHTPQADLVNRVLNS